MSIFRALKDIKDENLISFHMPGHKYKNICEEFYNNILDYDITEIKGADNLFDEKEAIKETNDFISDIFNTKKSYMVVGGTTAGIYAMIFTATNKFDKIIIARDCHKSVYNACLLNDLDVKYISPKIHNQIPMGVTLDSVKETVRKNPDAKALVITYPNYYGIGTDIKKISEFLKEKNILLLVDEAHGAHLFLSDSLMKSSLELGADMVVHSSHKSLPVLTQSSLLHINNDKIDLSRVNFFLSLFQTSSPSYVLMASIDICYRYLVNNGKNKMNELLKNIDIIRRKHNIFLEKEDILEGFFIDKTKLVITSKKFDVNTIEFGNTLREEGIEVEFSNINSILFLTTIMNESSDFNRVDKILSKYRIKNEVNKYIKGGDDEFKSTVKISLSEAFNKEGRRIKLKDSEGEISKEYVIPYPPGIPIIIPGEEITSEKLEIVRNYLKNNFAILNFNDFNNDIIEVI